MVRYSFRYGEYSMTPEETQAFCDGELQAVISSLRRNGAPFAIPLGYLFDGSTFYVTTAEGRGLAPRLRRDPRACLTVMSRDPYPTKFVIAEGMAEEVDDPGDEISKRIY